MYVYDRSSAKFSTDAKVLGAVFKVYIVVEIKKCNISWMSEDNGTYIYTQVKIIYCNYIN